MRRRQELQVIKVPIKGTILSKPQVFPRMPRLYLELIENKVKIKQDLINREYEPRNLDNKTISQHNSYESPSEKKIENSSKNFENRLDLLLNDNDSDNSSEGENSPVASSASEISRVSSTSDLSVEEEKNNDKDNNSEDSDNLSVRLKELLKDDSDKESNVSSPSPPKKPSKVEKYDKYSRHRDNTGHSIQHKNSIVPPTLAELEANGGFVPRKELRDINQPNVHIDQQQDDSKREILFKFDLLRKSYPSSTIPDYNIHTDLHLLEKSYGDCVRRLSLDSSVESYKTYLVYGFMGCEFIFGNFLGFDMQGFTQQQIISMHSYEKLLIELGEKSYVPTGSKWPVELRLLFMIIMNAAFFIVSKMMMKKTGANLMGMINTMNVPRNTQQNSAPKRKMKGPNVDLENIPEL